MIIWIFILVLVLAVIITSVIILSKQNDVMDNYKSLNEDFIVICGCVYECEPYLKDVLTNMEIIGSKFRDYVIIIAIDEGKDKSHEILEKWQKENPKLKILPSKRESEIRVQNICNARNRLMQNMRNIYKSRPFEYFLMMDCDKVSSKQVQLGTLKEVFDNKEKWDSVSFASPMQYYDIWALNYDDFYVSFLHSKNYHNMYSFVRKDIQQKLTNVTWYKVYSAFGGSAFYKTSMFLDLNYGWKIEDNMKFIDDKMLERHNTFVGEKYPRFFTRKEDCEHRFFHFQAYYNRDAKIYIYTKPLFPYIGH